MTGAQIGTPAPPLESLPLLRGTITRQDTKILERTMPTYVYECSSCEKMFEVDQRISESPLSVCHCGSEGSVKRVIQPIAVMFNGSGFHVNDYSKKSAPESCPPTGCCGGGCGVAE